jgi:hypothetical protein
VQRFRYEPAFMRAARHLPRSCPTSQGETCGFLKGPRGPLANPQSDGPIYATDSASCFLPLCSRPSVQSRLLETIITVPVPRYVSRDSAILHAIAPLAFPRHYLPTPNQWPPAGHESPLRRLLRLRMCCPYGRLLAALRGRITPLNPVRCAAREAPEPPE